MANVKITMQPNNTNETKDEMTWEIIDGRYEVRPNECAREINKQKAGYNGKKLAKARRNTMF